MSHYFTKGSRIEYSDPLRNKLMQINSHNVSCLYKATLQKHASEALRECEDDFDSYYCYSDQNPEARYVDWKPRYGEDVNGRGDRDNIPCNNLIPPQQYHIDKPAESSLSEQQYFEMLDGQLCKIKTGMLLQDLGNIQKNDDNNISSDESDDASNKVSVSLQDYYKQIRLYPEERFHNNNICAWRVCRGGHLDSFDPMLLQYHLEDDIFSESTRKLMNRRHYQMPKVSTPSGDRVPFGTSPYFGQSHPTSTAVQESKAVPDKQEKEKNLNNQNASTGETRVTKVAKSAVKKNRQKQKQKSVPSLSPKLKPQSQDVLKPSVQNLTDAPISYKFKHNSGYRTGYIQQYREQYTIKKLEHILLQCAQRYYASKQQQPVAKAAVRCTDVRDGACLINEGSPKLLGTKKYNSKNKIQGQKPLGLIRKKPSHVKVSQYKFDMVQHYRTHSVMKSKQDKPRPKSSNCSGDSSPCTTPIERRRTDMPVSLSLPGVQFKVNSTAETEDTVKPVSGEDIASAEVKDTEKRIEFDQAKTILSKILRGGSPIVSRSRPTIPSNSRGLVYASSVETPLHIVTGTKPLCRGKGKHGKSTSTGGQQTEETTQSNPGVDTDAESSTDGIVGVQIIQDQLHTQSTDDIRDTDLSKLDDKPCEDLFLHTTSEPAFIGDIPPPVRETSTIMQKTLAIVSHNDDAMSLANSEIYRDAFTTKAELMMERPTEPVLLLPKPQVPSVKHRIGFSTTTKKTYRKPFLKKK